VSANPSTLRQLYERLGPEGYRRAMAAACWEAGNLSYSLNEPQRRLRDLWYANKARGERRTVAKWARRVGKTRTCSALAFESALAGPRKRIPYAAQTQSAVKEFVVPHFLNLAGDAPDHLRPELVANEMRFQNGSRIVLQGCEDQLKADRLRGPAADDAFIDEGGFIPVLGYVVRDVIRPQLATTGGAMMLASSPPEAPDHPFDDFAAEAMERGAFLHFTVHDAPHLSPDEIADWCRDVGGPESIAWQREGLAMSVTDPTRAVLPEFSEHADTIVTDAYERPSHFHPLIVGDLGYVDMTVVLFGYIDFERACLVVEDELAIRRPTSDVIQREASKRAHALWGERPPLLRKLDGPPITVGDIARLERAELADPSIQPDKWATVYNGELSAAVNALRLRIKRGALIVHPRCRTLIAHARSARWNQARTSFERMQTDAGQHHYDGCAALVYLAREARQNEHRNPFPRLPSGIHPHTHRIPPELQGPDSRIQKFKQAFGAKRERR
jgi:hypothetical protein